MERMQNIIVMASCRGTSISSQSCWQTNPNAFLSAALCQLIKEGAAMFSLCLGVSSSADGQKEILQFILVGPNWIGYNDVWSAS